MPADTFNRQVNNYTNYSQNDCSDNNGYSECKEESRHHKKKEHMPIGMAYVPMQEWGELYDACDGLYEGCAFPELNLIFCGVRGN
jgi:hypothetical protein